MLCDNCKTREATIYYTEIFRGERKEQHLCEECVSEYTNYSLRASIHDKEVSLEGLLSSILSNYYSNQPEKEEAKADMVICDHCGMTYESFLQGGKFGCASCYRSFGKQIEKSFRQIHGATVHVGKRPVGFVSKMDKIINNMSEADRLSIQLQDAVEKEEFEEAVKLRDQIRDLKIKEESANA